MTLNKEKKNSDSLYLDQLEYTPETGKTFLNFFIKNFRVTVLIVLGILVWGTFSFMQMPLESMPEVKIPYGIVSVSLPGASPEDMEELVVKKIENKVASISGVKQVRSSALNSFAMVSVEFRASEDLKDAIRRLRDSVATLGADLPSDASDPQVMEVSFSNSPVWTLVVTGPYDNFTLRQYADSVKSELEKLPETSEVTLSGGDTYEIRVVYDPQKLQRYGISMDAANGMISAGNLAMPLGKIDVSNFEYTVRTDGKFLDAKELRNLPISNQNNQIVRLGDVAVVVEMAKERSVYSKFSFQGQTPQNAVTINVMKKTGSSIVELIDNGKNNIATLKAKEFPADVKVETTLDMSEEIRNEFSRLWEDGILTIILVTLILFLFVGLKEAFVAGLAVPLVFASTFGLMNLLGITLNFLSLFSLVLSLGLLVDDAIVVVQATKQYLKSGKFTPEEAVLLVFRDFKVLLATTTLTTIWAFLPLLLASGIIGQFIRSIPITVSVTLAASFFIAIIINHPMAIILERFRVTRAIFKPLLVGSAIISLLSLIMTAAGTLNIITGIIFVAVFGIIFFSLLFWYRSSLKATLILNEDLILQEKADPKKIIEKIHHHYLVDDKEKSFWARMIGGLIKIDKILPKYGKILSSLLSSKAKSLTFLFIVGLVFLGSLLLPITGVIKSEFLPPSDVEYLYINIEGAPGLVTERTKEVAAKVEEILLAEKSIESFEAVTGSSGVNVSSGMMTASGSGGQSNRAQFAINFFPWNTRPVSGPENKREKSYEIAKRLRQEIAPITGAKITVQELSGGPPSGSDFEVRLLGKDLKVLEREANKYKSVLSQIPGVINENISLTLSPGEFTIKLNPDQMQLRQLNSAQVAMTLRTAISGSDVTKIMRNGDEISVRAEFDPDKIDTIDQLKALTLVNPRGQIYQLSDIAEISLGSSLTSISHLDQKRVIVLSSGVEKPHLPSEVLSKFQELIKNSPLPEGYEIVYGGQNETNSESILSILQAMIIAVILIIATLVIQFNSFRKAILVLATIPLAMTGVFYGLALIGFTLSFPCLIGVCALFGIVVKNAVILVDKINLNLEAEIPYQEAIVDAAKSRLEAIFLTSICTIIGMIPITFADETWEGLGASLIFGLTTSTVLTLFVIPTLFGLLMKKSHKKDLRLRELEKQVV